MVAVGGGPMCYATAMGWLGSRDGKRGLAVMTMTMTMRVREGTGGGSDGRGRRGACAGGMYYMLLRSTRT